MLTAIPRPAKAGDHRITITPEEACAMYGLNKGTLANLRSRKLGCPYFKINRKILQAASEGGKAKKVVSDNLHQEWQDEADKIWEKADNLKKATVARRIVKQYSKDDKPTVQPATIARNIKK